MPDTEAPVTEPSLINEHPVTLPADNTPESKLYPEPTKPEPKPATPAEPAEPVNGEEPKPGDAKPADKKEEPKAEPSKPSTEAKPAPVDYESLKLPNGSLLSNDELTAIKKTAKESGLSLEEVQGVLEVKNDAVKAFKARQEETVVNAQKEWKAAWAHDPEFGGEKLAENTELAKRAWLKFADNELKTLANQTGMGNHPAVLRAFARIGRVFSEDQLVRGTVGGPNREKTREERLYGKTTPAPDEPMN